MPIISSNPPGLSEFTFSNGNITSESHESLLAIQEIVKNGFSYFEFYGIDLMAPNPNCYRQTQYEMTQAFEKIERDSCLSQRSLDGECGNGFVNFNKDIFEKEYYNILETITPIKKTEPDEDNSLGNSILQKGILQKNRDGKTPLHLAAVVGDTKAIVQMLDLLTDKDKEAYLQARDNLGQTPFHLAMLHNPGGNTLKVFLDALKDDKTASALLICDNYGKTALHYISDPQPLMIDPQNHMSKKLTDIFQKIRNPIDRYDLLEAVDKDGRTPLHYAAMGVDTDVLRTMIDITSDENLYQIDDEGKTFFHYLIRNNSTEFLVPYRYSNNLNHPANPANILSKRYQEFLKNIKNLLSRIEKISEAELVRFINIPDNDGKTALFYAASFHDTSPPSLTVLEKISSSYNKKICLTNFVNEVDTLFHFIARRKYPKLLIETLKLLSEDDRKYLIEMPNLEGETIFDILIKRVFDKTSLSVEGADTTFCPENRFYVIAKILRLFSEVNRVNIATRFDKKGKTLFHRAAYNTDPNALSTLLEVIHPKDRAFCLKIQEEEKKNTPLHYAAGTKDADQILNNVLMMVQEDDRAYCLAMQNEKEEDVLFLLLHHPTDDELALMVPNIITLLPEAERVPLLTRKDANEDSLIHDIAYQPDVLFKTLGALSKKEVVASCLKLQNKDLNTPLHILAKNKDFQLVRDCLSFMDRRDRQSCFSITDNKNHNVFFYVLKNQCPKHLKDTIYKLSYAYGDPVS